MIFAPLRRHFQRSVLLLGRDDVALLIGSRCYYGKTRSSGGDGANIDAMSEHFDGSAHDEQADTESITPRGIKPSECLKDSRQLLTRDTDARVANVDAHVLARTATANENPAFGFGIFDGVADQISEDAIEQHRIAHHGCAGGAHTDVDPLLQCAFLIFKAYLPK
jgi:hypothetical protein